ncbi:pyridoxal phosphate-dependent aminotransferase [Arsenicicoccus dermatophilus]|uniref:pyridoxal phosphate-dependent aminotransferase n=1 Tax=Arsenicicoccus dermatophilus TaxID=1076331 RepID=UPI001F4D0A97|nr:aminotransferase class I/II-fold pyridoxal phosphate-dependent enzyme [Arsenicicoccus dermatophilus]MCH8611747.1 aminotransferase class I/II-fold pyridoxal phosphate-dependent enzyme [Arsenicicoccus dermatophilus]
MALANRLSRLGTETAFAVSAAAAAWGAKGNTIYPFHLGDIDLATPGHITEAMNKAIADGRTGYCPGPGIPQLREAMAADINGARGTDYTADNVAIQPGGKPVITKFVQAVMNEGDEVLYPNPGFPIYESQIEYFGGIAKPYRYVPTERGFAIDLDQVRALITPRTKAIIYNDLQNPISAESTQAEREAIAQLAIEHDLWVLSDEAYFDMRYSGTSTSISSIEGMKDRTVILYTFSKKYAMTGWRLGAGIAPLEIAKVFSTMNTNNESCTTHFIQYAGVAALTESQQPVADMLQVLRGRRDTACEITNSIPGMSVAVPESTFYLFPDVTEAVQRVGAKDVDDFATQALHATGVSFCTRNHFGRRQDDETRDYIRFAYSGISEDRIREGLGKLKDWIESK